MKSRAGYIFAERTLAELRTPFSGKNWSAAKDSAFRGSGRGGSRRPQIW